MHAPQYFRMYPGRFGLRELIQICHPVNPISVSVAWSLDRLRIKPIPPNVLPHHANVLDCQIMWGNLPDAVQDYMKPRIEEVQALGFKELLLETQECVDGNNLMTTGYGAVLRSQDQQSLLNIAFSVHQSGVSQGLVSILSWTSESTLIATVKGKKSFGGLGYSDNVYHPDAAVSEIVQIHKERLKSIGGPARLIRSRDDLVASCNDCNRLWIEALSKMGVVEPVEFQAKRVDDAGNPYAPPEILF